MKTRVLYEVDTLTPHLASAREKTMITCFLIPDHHFEPSSEFYGRGTFLGICWIAGDQKLHTLKYRIALWSSEYQFLC
jgi:hypothetical protein